jgi:hypothetical protein
MMMKSLWTRAPWHLATPAFVPAKRAALFVVTEPPCRDCTCPAGLPSTVTNGEQR